MSPWISARSMSTAATSELLKEGLPQRRGVHALAAGSELDGSSADGKRVVDLLDGRLGIRGEEQASLHLVVAQIRFEGRSARRDRGPQAARPDRLRFVGERDAQLLEERLQGTVKGRREEEIGAEMPGLRTAGILPEVRDDDP